MKTPNPKHITAQPLPGQQLPDNWKNATADHGGTYDRRDLANLWKQETTTKKIEIDSPTRNARLKPLTWSDLYGSK